MLRTKLIKTFGTLVAVLSVLSAFVGIQTISRQVLQEALTRVRLDLESARAVCNGQLKEIETVLRLVASKQELVVASQEHAWTNVVLRADLERMRVDFGLDFLNVVSPRGQVVLRTVPPYVNGDYLPSRPVLAKALQGETVFGLSVFSKDEMLQESEMFSERAFFELQETPHARRSPRKEESRGMVMLSAVPIRRGAEVMGAAYGGVLINRNHQLVDRIRDAVYKDDTYEDMPLGTATLFLYDTRVATTVRAANGNRALGTRVSKEVADQVLDNGKPWVGKAFVVKDWYLTAYEPIRDYTGAVIGMLYVGILKKPFDDYGRSILVRYVLLSSVALVIVLVFAFIMADRLTRPIRKLVEAANGMSDGRETQPIEPDKACRETETLVQAFNKMAHALAEREASLKDLNTSYMETLGFVSHELKGPLGSVLNYVFLLNQKKLGPLLPKQQKAVEVIERNTKCLVEMVRHYLNLARIESCSLQPVPARVKVTEDVLDPLIESVRNDADVRGIRIENHVSDALEVKADPNMTREVFENLVSNAIKYGREGGALVLRGSSKGDFVECSVWNEGAGFSRDKADRLFQKFTRLDEGDAMPRGRGTGLGLFIARHIVEAHGGTIEARSEPGQWAEITFTLPCYDQENLVVSGLGANR